jgi:hypothetical protein
MPEAAPAIIRKIEAKGWRVIRGATAHGANARYVFWFRAVREGERECRGEGKTAELAARELARAVGIAVADA